MDPNIRGLFLLGAIIIVLVLVIKGICEFGNMAVKDCLRLFIRCPQIPALIIVVTAVLFNLYLFDFLK